MGDHVQLRDMLSRFENSEIVKIVTERGAEFGISTVKYWLTDSFRHKYDGLSGRESVLKVDITGYCPVIYVA